MVNDFNQPNHLNDPNDPNLSREIHEVSAKRISPGPSKPTSNIFHLQFGGYIHTIPDGSRHRAFIGVKPMHFVGGFPLIRF